MAALNLGNLEIPDGNAQAALTGFLAKKPNNRTVVDPENPEQEIPEFTNKQWLMFCIQKFVNKTCRQGWDIIRDRDAVIINDVFEGE